MPQPRLPSDAVNMAPTTDELSLLSRGASELGLGLDEAQLQQLLSYLDLLAKWNGTYNLTAVRDRSEMLTHHLLDSLAVVKPLMAQSSGMSGDGALRILDVGSGAGLPGVVLAICCPSWQVTCVDTVGKKVAFVQQVVAALGLTHLRAVHSRVENMKGPFDVICSRAFASLSDFTRLSRSLLAEQGVWMALKGKMPHDEVSALPAKVDVFHVEPLQVPGLKADRCIVWMRAVDSPGPK